jgi:hypothetical protein
MGCVCGGGGGVDLVSDMWVIWGVRVGGLGIGGLQDGSGGIAGLGETRQVFKSSRRV